MIKRANGKVNSLMPSERQLRIMYSVCLIALLIASVIPLIVISQYNHPSADDFAYADTTFREWNNSHSLLRLLGEAIATSKRFFYGWQGLYSSAFFLALHPAVFGEAYYSWTGVIMLCMIGGVTCALFVCLVKRLAGGSVLDGIAIGCVASFLMIQWMPSCVEGLYWYNGAVNYGLFYAIMLFLVCTVIGFPMLRR